MNRLLFGTIFVSAYLAGDLAFCRIAQAAVPNPPGAPVVKIGPASVVLVRIGRPYRIEYRAARRQPKPARKHRIRH